VVEAARLSVEREDWAYEKGLITGKLYEATQITPHYPHPHYMYPHYPSSLTPLPGCAPTLITPSSASVGVACIRVCQNQAVSVCLSPRFAAFGIALVIRW